MIRICLNNDSDFHTFETENVLITMTMLAAMTASKLMIFPPRMTLRIMYPGPASFLLVNIILSDRLRLKLRNLTICVG
jgi:hypothetical protein